MSYVEMILGNNKGSQIILPYTTWKAFIERRADIERLVRSTLPSSRLVICDLVIEIVKIRDENIVKLTLLNTSLYMKPLTILFLYELEHCAEYVYNQLHQKTYSVSDKYKHFVSLLRQNYITTKHDAVKLLNERYDKTCIIDCELMTYGVNNILYDALCNN